MYELRSALRSGALNSAVQNGRAEHPFFFSGGVDAQIVKPSHQRCYVPTPSELVQDGGA